MRRRLRTTPRADAEVRRIDRWWSEHRPAAPDLFLDELADAFAMLTAAPELGRPYRSSRVQGARRLLLRATRYHVYFRLAGDDVIVLAVWSAVRGRGPRL